MAQNLVLNILAKDKTKQALTSVRGSLAKVKSAVFSLQTAFVGLGAGLVIRNLVSTGRELENLRVRLKFLLKDTNEGTKAFDNMVKFASKVPFSLEEIQSGSGILATVTDNADDLQKMLEITGNVAATTGLDFRTAAEQIQRSFSAGIGAADLFREKGVRNMLGFKAGATVSIEDTVAAFERVFGKGGRFGNSTDELAQTFTGTLSMIGDKIFNFKKVLLEAGFFEELKKQFGDLDTFLEDNAKKLDDIAIAVGRNLAKAIKGAVDIGKDLIPVIREIGEVLASIIKGFNELPAFVKSIGLVGAMLFGKKGAAALAGISFIIGKIKELSELPQITPINELDLKTVQDFNHEIEKLKKQIESPVKIGTDESGLDVFTSLTDTQIKNNKLLTDQIALLEEARNLIKGQLPHHAELHKGLEIINEEHKKTKDLMDSQKQKVKNIHEAHLSHKRNVEAENSLRMEILEKVKKQNEEFSLSQEIFEGINRGVSTFSKGIAEAIVMGKKINMTFKQFAQQILVEIIAKTIERMALLAIEELLLNKLFKKEKDKKHAIDQQNSALKQQIALQAILMAMGGGGIPFFHKGGAVSKGKPIVVGERGPELFIPNATGQITQSARGTGGGPVNVNFNITTVDARSFDQLLVQRRGTISRIINESVNERGREALI
jgi:hypothetical protein